MVDLIKELPPIYTVWSSYGHRFITASDEIDSCLTCGAAYYLVNLGGGRGEYRTNTGDEPMHCTGRTDLAAHGPERHCEADNGRGCADDIENGTCEHTDYTCNCVQCDC